MSVKVKEIIIRYEDDEGKAKTLTAGANSIENYRPLRLDIHHHMAPPPPEDEKKGTGDPKR